MIHITLHWDNPERTILRWDFMNGWTWEELMLTVAQADKLLASVPHNVDYLINMEASPALPQNVFSMYKGIIARRKKPDNRGMILVVGCSPFIRNMIDAFNRINGAFRLDFSLAISLTEARQILSLPEEAGVG